MWDERISQESLQRGPHKTQYSVNYVVYEERAHDNTSCRTLIPSFRGLGKERLYHDPLLATKNGLHYVILF